MSSQHPRQSQDSQSPRSQSPDPQPLAPVLTGQLRPVERCSQCAASFVCGYAAGLPQCWCTGQPLSPARLIVAGQHCLCPGCLAERHASATEAGNAVTTVRDK